ncbi:hypothetical protein B0H19DRAFT_1332118 [Mycena capillaripes]|nr:hypothetical protein B0H19DRAFT_1332118 [Mycena capillaripes]
MPTIPIPRPSWSPTRTKTEAVGDLLKVMPGWNEQEFTKLKVPSPSPSCDAMLGLIHSKEYIRAKADEFALNTCVNSRAQDPAKWDKVVADCCRRFPALDDFEDQWPVDIYYAKWVHWRAVNEKRRIPQTQNKSKNSKAQKRKERGDAEKENEQSSSTATNKQTVHASHRTPPSQSTPQNASATRIHPQSGSRQKSQIQPQLTPNQTLPPSTRTITSSTALSGGPRAYKSWASISGAFRPAKGNPGPSQLRKKHSPSSTQIVSSTNPSVPSSSPPFPTSSASTPPCAQLVPGNDPKTRAHWGPCVLCGFQTPRPIPPSETAQLHKCFKDRTDLLRVLAYAGVVVDHHFRALLRLTARRRTDFLHGLASTGRLTYVEKIEILDVLETHIESVESIFERAKKVQLKAIPRPSEAVENVLAQHTCKHSNVKRHMQIVDDDEYFELVNLIEREVARYLDISIPMEEQEEEFDSLVTSICEEKPSVRKYDEQWPIYLHIRRFMSAHDAGLPKTPQSSHTSSTSSNSHEPVSPASSRYPFWLSPSLKPHHECPVLSMYLPVPPSVAALLADYEMEELGPAFLSLGIISDAKLANIVASPRAKREFLAGLAGQLKESSAFQGVMVGEIVERV